MKERSLYWIIGFLGSFSGVVLPGNVTITPGGGMTSVHSLSAFIIDIKITNRIYNDSLMDHQSLPYKILRREVENAFSNTYSLTPALQYEGISEMTFSNGSVIATSTALFSSEEINPNVVKNIFVSNYRRNPSVNLDLNLSYTQDQEPTHETLHLEVSTAATTSLTHSSTHFSTDSSTHPLTQSSAHSSPQTSTHSSTHSSTQVSTHSSLHTSTITTNHPSTDPTSHTSPQAQSHTLTGHVSSTTTHQFNGSNDETHTTERTTDNSTHLNGTVGPQISSSSTIHPSNLTTSVSNQSASNHTTPTGGKVSVKPPVPGRPDTTHMLQSTASSTTVSSAAEQGVPGWGVALLVLAAIILFLLLLLFILLLLCWCCWWRRRGFMNVSDPDPPGYYNPDIPMYSTHSTFDSHYSKSPDSDSEKPPKNRTGMYVVNN